MSSKEVHGDASDVGLVEIQLVSPAKQEPAEDTSARGRGDARAAGSGAQRAGGGVPPPHAAGTPAQDPSTRRDGSSAAGVGLGAPDSGAATRAPGPSKTSRQNQDKSTKQDKSVKQDKSIRQDRSTKQDRSSRGAGNLDSSTRSTTREKVGTVLQRVMSVTTSLHPYDPRRSGPQARTSPPHTHTLSPTRLPTRLRGCAHLPSGFLL